MHLIRLSLLLLAGVVCATPLAAAPFTAGNVVVYRAGDGSSGLVNTGSAVFLDEFTPSGELVQSIPLPVAVEGSNFPLIASGTATSEGLLTRSADRRFLLLTGYGRAIGGTGSLAGTAGNVVPRVVGRVDASGVVDTSTALADFATGNNPRSAVSSDGKSLWVAGGAGGVRHAALGGISSVQLSTAATNLRQVDIADGQLYVSTASGSTFRLAAVGTGLPTTEGQAFANLPGFPTSTGSPYAYAFVDLSEAVAGLDTLYVADDNATIGGIAKYSLVDGSWVSNGTAGAAGDAYRGIVARREVDGVRLFATRRGGSAAAGGGELVAMLDASGFNGAISGTPGLLATAAANTAFRGVAFAPEAELPPLGPLMRITEYMYQGANGEFVEFTNVGDAPADLAGWSFDDDSRVPGSFALGTFGIVQPGESVILTEAGADAFRTAWSLCAGVRVIGGLTQNLGRNDELNLFDDLGELVDRLSYGDQNFPGSIRTQNRSGWVSSAGLGANLALEWTLSSIGDAEASVASVGGDLGSPGRSERAAFDYDPCAVQPGAPEVTVNPTATSVFLDLPVNGGGAASGVIGDGSDPAAVVGIGFTLLDEEGDPELLNVIVDSDNPTVVDVAGLLLSGSGANRQLRVEPSGVGLAAITLRASDGAGREGSYRVEFAASQGSPLAAQTRWHTGASDASTALALDADWMLVADDEGQLLRLYRRDLSGLHQDGFDFTAALELTDVSGGVPREVDIEASTRLGDRLFWSGSHGNQATGAHNPRPNRRRLFATDLTPGEIPSLAYAGRYDFLAEDLLAWDEGNGHGLGAGALGLLASSQPGVSPESPAGFNIEGLAMAPDGSSAYVAFRAPLLPLAARTEALIVPVLAFDALVTGAAPASRPAGSATFGAPILLNLGGRGIRSIEANASGDYVILAGPVQGAAGALVDFRMYRWSGVAEDPPVPMPTTLTVSGLGGSPEGLVEVPDPLQSDVEVQIIVDNGDTVFYGDGVAAKDLAERRHAKFRSQRVLIRSEDVFANGFEETP